MGMALAGRIDLQGFLEAKRLDKTPANPLICDSRLDSFQRMMCLFLTGYDRSQSPWVYR